MAGCSRCGCNAEPFAPPLAHAGSEGTFSQSPAVPAGTPITVEDTP